MQRRCIEIDATLFQSYVPAGNAHAHLLEYKWWTGPLDLNMICYDYFSHIEVQMIKWYF